MIKYYKNLNKEYWEAIQIKLKDDENLLICSDGVYNLLDRKKMMKLLNEEIDIELKINMIKEKVLSLGGTDNLTLILLEK